jgi:NitT/TauT family transport system substrate-binding protein
MRFCLFICLSLVFNAGLNAQNVSEKSPTLEPVTLTLLWQHQSQFAGYYMALNKGYYTREGLDVKILRGGPDISTPEQLRTESTDFVLMMLSCAMEQRSQGVPIVQIAQIVNRSNMVLLAWRDSPETGTIDSLKDLDGKCISLWMSDFQAPYQSLFTSQQVRPVVIPQYYSLSLFLHRGVSACAAMRYNEYNTLLQSGVQESDLRIFSLHDAGIQLPEDGIYCLEKTLNNRPETCRKFARASIEGWRYANDHADETLNVVMDYVQKDNLPTNRMHMRWMLKEILPSIFPDRQGEWIPGKLSRPAFEQTRQILIRNASLKNAPTFEALIKEEENDAGR